MDQAPKIGALSESFLWGLERTARVRPQFLFFVHKTYTIIMYDLWRWMQIKEMMIIS